MMLLLSVFIQPGRRPRLLAAGPAGPVVEDYC